MVNRALVGAVSLSVVIGWAVPGHAQMRTSRPSASTVYNQASQTQPIPGPTRVFIVPRGDTLPMGTSVTSANLQLNTTAPAQVLPGIGVPAPSAPGVGLGFGYAGNALSVTNQSSMGLFQLDTGITAYATTPWQGRLDVAGKIGLLQPQFGSPLALAGLAGIALNLDANGTPSLGLTLGVPISGALAFTPINRLMLTVYPNWGTGLVAPGTIGAGIFPATRFAVGVGGGLTLTDTLAILADTSLIPAGGVEGSNLGLRFGLTPAMTFDLYAGMGANTPVGATPMNIGAGINWQY